MCQIELIGPNSKFYKAVIRFKFYSRVCRCSSQVYTHYCPLIPSKGIYNFFSTDGPTNLLIEAPFRSLKIGLHLNRFYVKFTSKSMYKKYIYTTLMKAKAIVDLKQKEQRQQIHNKRLLNSNLNHLILLDNTKNVTIIRITFNNDKKKSNENSYFNLDLVVMRLTRHIHISLCHLVMYESILLGKQRLLIRLLSGMVF